MIFEGKENDYTKAMVTGSGALLCASCEDSNETWLPILEKAYAKIHGDYHSISGGFSGYGPIPASWMAKFMRLESI
jgi:hypothetical protein